MIDRWLAGAVSGYTDELTLKVPFDDICEFGGCALCGDHDGFVVINNRFWFFCHAHKVCWCGGTDLFPVFNRPTSEEWEARYRLVETYRDITPLDPPLSAMSL